MKIGIVFRITKKSDDTLISSLYQIIGYICSPLQKGMRKSVLITGTGIVSAIGMNTQEQYDSLINLRSGYGKIEILETIHRDTLPACEVKLTEEQLCDRIGVAHRSGYTRPALLGIIAVKEALASAQITDIKEVRTGLISSSTVGGMREFEASLLSLLDEEKMAAHLPYAHVADMGEHTQRIADYFGFKDYVNTVSTACSSASNAMILGAELIQHGILDRVICGGADVLCRFTLNGFNSLLILDKVHSRPFDATRGGLNLGEAAAYVVLERADIARKGNRKIWAELKGYSNSNDAFHQTASSPDGDGAMLSMQRAMTMAGLQHADIHYINCHGTATENNDLSEALAIQKLFGEDAPPFGSTKPYTGHTLAAAGGVEAIYSLLSMEHGVLFPNLNFQNQMPELKISPIKTLLKDRVITNVLSNSFGFGGSNTSLIFSKVSD